ncbi:MAG: 2-C-methyl-D-erythritol 4-phosphate cytidylyltransferase [Nitrospirae bacterium]|nr:2-C-methyl-D-erythritol 4-phosphate cytidylyltransferase [Nitrospirota bacterium]
MNEHKVAAIVPAAGLGKRFGNDRNKSFYELSGKPLIVWALEALQDIEEITEIIPVLKEEDLSSGVELIEGYNIHKVKRIVTGGKERQDSVYNGLKALDDDTFAVVIHDGARPLVERVVIKRTINELKGFDGAVAGVPVKDTIKEAWIQAADIVVQKTLDRNILWAVQTPQTFHFQKIRDAHEMAHSEGHYATDDAALIERYGGKIKIIEGSYRNIKITTPEDIHIAEALIKNL